MVFRDRPPGSVSSGETYSGQRLQTGTRYRLMQDLGSIVEPFTVQTDEGNAAFTIEFTRREMMEVLVLRDMAGSDRCLIPSRQATSAATTEILGANGQPEARVTRTPISAVRDRFEVGLAPGGFWDVMGNVGSREFTLHSSNGQIAEVSRRWFLRPDSFGVEVIPGQNDALVLAVTTTIDLLAHGFDL